MRAYLVLLHILLHDQCLMYLDPPGKQDQAMLSLLHTI